MLKDRLILLFYFQEALKFCHHKRSNKLSHQDIDNALKVNNSSVFELAHAKDKQLKYTNVSYILMRRFIYTVKINKIFCIFKILITVSKQATILFDHPTQFLTYCFCTNAFVALFDCNFPL